MAQVWGYFKGLHHTFSQGCICKFSKVEIKMEAESIRFHYLKIKHTFFSNFIILVGIINITSMKNHFISCNWGFNYSFDTNLRTLCYSTNQYGSVFFIHSINFTWVHQWHSTLFILFVFSFKKKNRYRYLPLQQ